MSKLSIKKGAKSLKNKLICAVFLLIPSVCNSEGAFGLDFGAQISDPVSIDKIAGLFKIVPNKTNRLFDSYAVYFEPSLGICKITANGPLNSDDRFGRTAVKQYETFRGDLEKTYGFGQQYEFMAANADLDDDDEFALSISKNARIHSTLWSIDKSDNFKMTANVSLEIKAIKQDTWINVSFEADFFNSCIEKIRTQTD